LRQAPQPRRIVIDEEDARGVRVVRDGLGLWLRSLVAENLEDERLEVVPGLLALVDAIRVEVLV
jgi:hypothetical protein